VLQGGDRFGNHRRLMNANHHKDHAAVHRGLFRLQHTKTVVTLVCLGTVGGLYYMSLDRQNRRKLRATADGVVRFLRY